MVKIREFITDDNEDLLYPSSDGKPMADNTLQFEWIVKIKLNLDRLTVHKKIFVAGDLLWYPVQGQPKNAKAPDVLVAIGRPKGHRRSYLQWREGNIAPQVVFEILSKSNNKGEMDEKYIFYNQYGVQEYYLYDPDKNIFTIYPRKGTRLELQPVVERWTSPLLGIHFHWKKNTLKLFDPDYQSFSTYLELSETQAKAIEELKDAHDVITERDRVIAEQSEMLTKNKEVIAKKDKKLAKRNEKLAEQDEKLAEQDEKLAEQDEKLAQKDEIINDLQEEAKAYRLLLEKLKQSGIDL